MFVNLKNIKIILNRENTFADCDFVIDSWEDDFIVELLKWYDNKVSNIRKNKRCCGFWDEEKWTQYYEQMFRMLYYAVITLKLRFASSMKSIFNYFFEVEDEDPYGNHPDLMSAEKLLQVYFYIIRKIGKKRYGKNYHVHYQLWPFVGHWDTEQMKDMYEHLNVHEVIYGKACNRYEEKKSEEEEEDEAMERDCKLLKEILDRMKKRVEDHLKESSKK